MVAFVIYFVHLKPNKMKKKKAHFLLLNEKEFLLNSGKTLYSFNDFKKEPGYRNTDELPNIFIENSHTLFQHLPHLSIDNKKKIFINVISINVELVLVETFYRYLNSFCEKNNIDWIISGKAISTLSYIIGNKLIDFKLTESIPFPQYILDYSEGYPPNGALDAKWKSVSFVKDPIREIYYVGGEKGKIELANRTVFEKGDKLLLITSNSITEYV